MKGLSSRVFRAPLAHWMRIAPLAAAVATAHKRVMVDHERFNGRYSDCRANEHHSSRSTASRPDVTVDALVERDLLAAPGVLPPANLPLVRHRRGRLHRAYGHAGRDQHRARTEPRCSLLQYPHRLLPQLRRETRPAHCAVDPGGAAALPRRRASTAGASWSATASRSPSAAARCRRSSSCISSPKQIPSPNSSWGTRCRR